MRRDYRGERLRAWYALERHAPRRRVLRVGLPGFGKSLLTVKAGLEAMEHSRVWANFELVHPKLGVRAGYCGSWDAFRHICELPGRDKVVLLQEANLLCSSREFSKLPLWVHKLWAQTRHYGVELLMDAQHEDRLDRVMREILDYVVLCEPSGLRDQLGLPLYWETWAYLEQVAAVRSGNLLEGDFERNVKVKGERFLTWVPGYVHTAYATHEILEPWRYDADSGVEYRGPAIWTEDGWVAA